MSGTSVHEEQGAGWGELVSRLVVPAGHGRAFEARAGDHIVVTDLEGAQVGDFVAFNADDVLLGPGHGEDPVGADADGGRGRARQGLYPTGGRASISASATRSRRTSGIRC